MNLTKNLGMLLLGIWLIVTGLLQVVSVLPHRPSYRDRDLPRQFLEDALKQING